MAKKPVKSCKLSSEHLYRSYLERGMGDASHRWRELFAFPKIYMKNHNFESWTKEYKDINNNLAVPAYRSFCKAYGINFHFGDEIKNFDHNKHPAILLDEMPLHGKALSLFNFVNKPYHPFREGLVSFAYTSWNDFDYENLTLEEIASEMESKDANIKKLKYKTNFYYLVAVFSSSLLVALIASQITNSNNLSIVVSIISFVLLSTIPQIIYKRKNVVEQSKFDKKLFELQKKLKDISIKYEHPVVVNTKPQPFNPINFPTLVKYDSQKVEDSVQKLMKNRSMTRHQAMVNLEQDLMEIEAQSGKSEEQE